MRTFGRLSGRRRRVLVFVFALSLGCVACKDEPIRNVVGTDGGRDAAIGDASDASADAALDADLDADLDAGTPLTGCTPGSPVDLFTSAHLVSAEIPFAAGANVGGLVVASTVKTEATYPSVQHAVVRMTPAGAVSTLRPLAAVSMVMATKMDVVRSGSGFLVAFDDTPSVGMTGPEVYARYLDADGVPTGADPVRITTTASSETYVSLERTSSGFVAAWTDGTSGPMTTLLDVTPAISAGPFSAASAIGMSTRGTPYLVAGVPYLAYRGANEKIRHAAVEANGALSPTHVDLSSVGTASGAFAVAGDVGGAGLAYESVGIGARTAIQFRAIGGNGTASVVERTITATTSQGYRPSMVALAGGYLVLFRHVPNTGNATLRLALVGTYGDLLAATDLVDSFPSGVRFEVVVSPDGVPYIVYHVASTIMVGMTALPAATVRAIRLECQ